MRVSVSTNHAKRMDAPMETTAGGMTSSWVFGPVLSPKDETIDGSQNATP